MPGAFHPPLWSLGPFGDFAFLHSTAATVRGARLPFFSSSPPGRWKTRPRRLRSLFGPRSAGGFREYTSHRPKLRIFIGLALPVESETPRRGRGEEKKGRAPFRSATFRVLPDRRPRSLFYGNEEVPTLTAQEPGLVRNEDRKDPAGSAEWGIEFRPRKLDPDTCHYIQVFSECHVFSVDQTATLGGMLLLETPLRQNVSDGASTPGGPSPKQGSFSKRRLMYPLGDVSKDGNITGRPLTKKEKEPERGEPSSLSGWHRCEAVNSMRSQREARMLTVNDEVREYLLGRNLGKIMGPFSSAVINHRELLIPHYDSQPSIKALVGLTINGESSGTPHDLDMAYPNGGLRRPQFRPGACDAPNTPLAGPRGGACGFESSDSLLELSPPQFAIRG
ncbi:hypothetical protein KM043_011143 [Ampulex compressa]|nr:hypothetical protein KM043_011143 [Ampulex compressa]